MLTFIDKSEAGHYVGFEPEPTAWHQITQEAINQFADCTLDHQFIHVDPVAAKDSPFGSTIAHGFLSLSMLSHFAEQYSVLINGMYMGLNYGFDKVRFMSPVKVNSRIRARAKILEMTEQKPGQFRVKTEVLVEIEGEQKPALVAEWLSLQLVA